MPDTLKEVLMPMEEVRPVSVNCDPDLELEAEQHAKMGSQG